MRSRLAVWLALSCLAPAPALAQDSSHWGVVVSFAPEHSWKTIAGLSEFLFDPGETVDIRSTDFRIGIARGRTLGGDWGVSYVRRTIADGSRFENTTELCTNNTTCQTVPSEIALTRGVTQSGIEAHKFVPFVTIKRRAQIGMNFAGGISKWDGTVEFHEFETQFNFDPRTRQSTFNRVEAVSGRPMTEVVQLSPFPFGKVEAAAAAIVAPALKIRVAGGFDFPGYTVFTVTGLYLFGAK